MHRIPRRCTIGSARKMPRIGVSRRPGPCYVSGEAVKVRSHADFRRSSRTCNPKAVPRVPINGYIDSATTRIKLRCRLLHGPGAEPLVFFTGDGAGILQPFEFLEFIG